MYAFLQADGFFKHRIQKGLLPKLSGTFEHTAQMANVINNARSKQRSLVVTLLDLKNAFGDTHGSTQIFTLLSSLTLFKHLSSQLAMTSSRGTAAAL